MATAQVFSFFRPTAPRDWSSQDIAEFYRVESILIQAGLRVITARGLSDEGDPWFVFCRAEDDEVIIHFARIDGNYVISAPAYCGNAAGRDFRSLVRSLIEQHPMLQLRPRPDNLYLHPAALLVVLVATALVKLSPSAAAAPAAPDGTDGTGERFRGSSSGLPVLPKTGPAPLSEVDQGTLIQAAINGALALTVVAGPVTPAGPAAIHAFDISAPAHVTVVDVSLFEMLTSLAPSGTGSLTPAVVQHELTSIALPADVTNQTATFTALPVDAIVAAGAVSSSLPPPVVALDPAAGVTYVSLSGLASISQADKAVLQTLGLTGNVSFLNGLPQVFSDVVKTGSHTEVHTATAQTQHAAADTTQAAPASTTAADPATATPATAPTTGSDTTPSSPASAPAAAAPVPDINTVITVVSEFLAIAKHPVYLVSSNASNVDAIFYDEQAVATQLSAVKSITYDFGDGFSISLVGLPAELAYAVHAVAHV